MKKLIVRPGLFIRQDEEKAKIEKIEEAWKEDNFIVIPPEFTFEVVEEYKQGKWEKGYTFPDGAYYKCSCCNELIRVRIPMHFCSNCGADMRGSKNG